MRTGAQPRESVGDTIESDGAGEECGNIQLAGGEMGEGPRKFLRVQYSENRMSSSSRRLQPR